MVQKGKKKRKKGRKRKRRGRKEEGGRELSGEERKVQKEDVGKQGEQLGTPRGRKSSEVARLEGRGGETGQRAWSKAVNGLIAAAESYWKIGKSF